MRLADLGTSKSLYTTNSTFGSLMGEVLNNFGNAIVAALHKSIESKGKNATGHLADSIHFDIIEQNQKFTFELFIADYYKWVDEGRKPGKFPWDKSKGLGDEGNVIFQWLKVKGITSYSIAEKTRNIKPNKFRTLTKGTNGSLKPDANLRSIAFLIGRSIAKKGIKPTHFYSEVVNDDAISQLHDALRDALKREVLISIQNGNDN